MIDFLKLNPYVTREEYMWEWTVPQIKLASHDFSHLEYGKEHDKNVQEVDDPMMFMKQFGLGMLDNNLKK